jgi:3-carboxy-cis,cis-muconate cycloisomerase
VSLDPGFTTSESRRIFGFDNRLARMLEVESALARASAAAGVMPTAAAEAIRASCESWTTEESASSLFAAGWEAGSPVVPLVARLRELVGEDAAPYVHLGATTQDVVDTGLVLQIREGLGALERHLVDAGRILAALAERHRDTVMAGRTLMQPAAPITFGLKAAGWLDGLTRDLERTRRLPERLALQLGGPVGTLAGFGERGLAVAEEMGRILDLPVPAMPWHTARDRIAETAAVLALASRTVVKVAGDLILLAQAEVGEVSMRAGGSSSLEGKRNPIDAIRATAAARFAGGQAAILLAAVPYEHERAAGAWHTEWVAVPTLFHGTLAAVEALGRALSTLEVHAERMSANLGDLGSDAGLAGRFVDRVLDPFREAVR